MPDLQARAASAWQSITDVQARVSGAWQEIQEIQARVSGAWQLVWERAGGGGPPTLALDTVSYKAYNSATTTPNTSHTIAATANLVLLALGFPQSPQSVNSVTVGGKAAYHVKTQAQGSNSKVELWACVDPPTGAQTVQANLASSDEIGMMVASFIGAARPEAADVVTGTTTNSTGIDLSVSSASGDICIDFLYISKHNRTGSADAGQTEQVSDIEVNPSASATSFAGGLLNCSTETATGATTAMGWTPSGNVYSSFLGLAIKQWAGTPTDTITGGSLDRGVGLSGMEDHTASWTDLTSGHSGVKVYWYDDAVAAGTDTVTEAAGEAVRSQDIQSDITADVCYYNTYGNGPLTSLGPI